MSGDRKGLPPVLQGVDPNCAEDLIDAVDALGFDDYDGEGRRVPPDRDQERLDRDQERLDRDQERLDTAIGRAARVLEERRRARARERYESAKSWYENENWLRPKAPPFDVVEAQRLGLSAELSDEERHELILRAYEILRAHRGGE